MLEFLARLITSVADASGKFVKRHTSIKPVKSYTDKTHNVILKKKHDVHSTTRLGVRICQEV